jgi:glycosyltransferase involved in cell wall biosynthesis
MIKRKARVLILLNTAWNLLNFRAGLITELIAAGYEVIAVAPHDKYVEQVKALGCRFVPIPMDNLGKNPGSDLLLLWRLFWLLHFENPDVFLGFTVKPNIYGSIASKLRGIPVINNIAGLGAVFIKNNWLTCLVLVLYRFALSGSKKVFFQNEDDKVFFVKRGLVKTEISDTLPGSGVNLNYFEFFEMPKSEAQVKFLLISRMLWTKGIGEYVEAAKLVKSRFPNVDFCLIGFFDEYNPAAISQEQMNEWVTDGYVKYLGETDDVRPYIASATCVVLPSFYREGVPRSLLEAAAVGRPIITTDVIGCRDVVDNGLNGFLCKPNDSSDLADKMNQFIALNSVQRAEMGRRGREKIVLEFDEKIVINKYLKVLKKTIPT